HVAGLLLHQIERRQHRRALPIGRILRDDVVELRPPLRRERERRSLVERPPLGLLELLRLLEHPRVESHRPTSPMTTSVEPMTAMTSAIMPPMIAFGSAW